MAVTNVAKNTDDAGGDVIKHILSQTDKLGDLPIFSATLNNVRRVSSNPDSHAMELAQAVMKDVNLSVKLLKLANSPYFNRGMGKINSISRAVVLLGYNTIKNMSLTLKLIESFQDDHPTVCMSQMVVRSYLTASFVKDVALRARVKNAEESYICALMHNLGEITVGYFLPERFADLVRLEKESKLDWTKAQVTALGTTLPEIGQRLAASWDFSNTVVSTMKPYDPETAGPVRNHHQLNHALAAMGSQAIGSLYLNYNTPTKDLRGLLADISDAAGLKLETIQASLTQSFHDSCEMAKEYGLDSALLQPVMRDSDDDLRERFAREFSFYAANVNKPSVSANAQSESAAAGAAPAEDSENVLIVSGGQRKQGATETIAQEAGESPSPASVAPASSQAVPAQPFTAQVGRGDLQKQLAVIQEITAMVSESASLNKLFVKVLEGIQLGVGFDRAVLCLLNPNRTAYSGRIALGNGSDILKAVLSRNVDLENDVFSQALLDDNDIVVEDITDARWHRLVPGDFQARTGATAFIISAVRGNRKPIGFFYADNAHCGEPITEEARRGFLQFVAQARLAIQVCS